MALTPAVSSAPPSRDPVLAALERIERRLERVEATLAAAETLTKATPGYAAVFADSFDDHSERLQARGVDVDARVRAVASLVERLSDPPTLAAIERTVAFANTMPGGVAAAIDSFDHWVGVCQSRGIDLDQRLQTLVGVAERLTAPEALSAVRALLDHLDELQAIVDSEAMSPSVIKLLVATAEGAARSVEQPPSAVGPLGALLALRDPDVQRALGLALRLAGHVGRSLTSSPLPPSPPPAALPRGARS